MKAFASQADLEVKKTTFAELAEGIYCLTAEGDPNSGVIVGDDGVMVIDVRATPVMAQELIAEIRKVTDKPIKHLVLSHYHAVRVLGASAYGAENIIASDATYDLIQERGAQDYASEVQRFPRLFKSVETVPGLTWPSIVFKDRLVVRMGNREVHVIHAGRGHTKGDTIVWMPKEKVLFSGDLVEYGATPYCGDAYFTDWPQTLDRLAGFGAEKMVPGRGEALQTPEEVAKGLSQTRDYLSSLAAVVKEGVDAGHDLQQVHEEASRRLAPKFGHWVIFEHCLPFNVSRCYDEMSGIADPRIWTAERDMEMWKALNA
jgi:glyoxylase-like metal-dependent hydrolase (beta-lactamase superfamily II)